MDSRRCAAIMVISEMPRKLVSRTVFIFTCIAASCWATRATAEPYLAVYKGMQCSTCHIHPAGGGMRTPYGNVYAQTELAETTSTGNELWTGEVVSWLSVGGDLRAEYRYVETPNADSTSTFDLVKGTAYVEARIVPGRLSIYIDQQLAPGASLNREAYIRLNSRTGRFFLNAGQFFLPFGHRLQDDTAFIRQMTGINFTVPDRGVQGGYESGPWNAQISVTNGSGGGRELDRGKQIGLSVRHVRSRWRVGASANTNDSDFGDRNLFALFAGVRTGPVAWLAEIDRISDAMPGLPDRDAIAGLLEANWVYRQGHSLKASYDYFDPDDDASEDHRARYSLVWEYTPMPFLQVRAGARLHDGVPESDLENRNEFFAELHAFF